MSDTIFMIHGMWGGPWCWDNYQRVFEAQGYRCVVPALPHHDTDPRAVPDPGLGTASLLDYARFLEREILQLGERPVVMGHSMGGLLAQMLSARGLAKALVLLSPASPSGIVCLKPSVLRSFSSLMTTWGFWRKPMRLPFGSAAYSILHLVPANERKDTHDRFLFDSGRAACEIGFWFFDPTHASRVDESKVTCPVLVVAGALDRMTPASVVRRVARKYGTVSTYKEFEHHSHWVLGEPQWQEIAEYVGDWLGSLPADS